VRRGPRIVLVLLLAGLVAVLGSMTRGVWNGGPPAQPVVVTVPELSPTAREGRQAFDRQCADCHGRHAAGTALGPPLVHPIYRSAHHADAAFVLAVQRGVAAHHWRFGGMPPQREIPRREIEAITRYVRELQRANGIE
jgi:mono/diheme cytochrome c family protein